MKMLDGSVPFATREADRQAEASYSSWRARVLRPASWFAATGLRMFLALMLALLPLGVVSVLSTIQAIRTMEMERVAALQLSVAQGASHLLGEISNDLTALRLVTSSIEEDPAGKRLCGRAARQMHSLGDGIHFAMYSRSGVRLCQSGESDASIAWGTPTFVDGQASLSPDGRRMIVRVDSVKGGVEAVASYGADQLADMLGGVTVSPGYMAISLRQGATTLPLVTRGTRDGVRRTDSATAPLNLSGMQLAITMQRPPVKYLRLMATMLPVFLWISAAAMGWWVVNRNLVRPLVVLNRQVATYQPGKPLNFATGRRGLAWEIDMLADSFSGIAKDVEEHDAQLAQALHHQQNLTREVHHRVKNNLQIISSLINLHSRAAATSDASAAYASIQRRVDALSVVHRNHYAATEQAIGIDARALISELASALKASGPEGRSGFAIRVDCEHLLLSQDVALPTAFLIAELVELVILTGAQSAVWIMLHAGPEDGQARLSIRSDALRPGPEVDALLADRFGRVLVGLSRQLRAELALDADSGSYAISLRTQ